MTELRSYCCDQCGTQTQPIPSWKSDHPQWSTIPAGLFLSAYGGGSTVQVSTASRFCTAECLRIYILEHINGLTQV